MQVSYPKYFYPQSGGSHSSSAILITIDFSASVNLFAAMNLLGLPTQFDPNDGTSAGPALVPTDIDRKNQTRSDARRTYYDPYVNVRSNFHVITGQHVTRLLIEGVGENEDVSNPTSSGDITGDGGASGDNEGFGFGPGGSTTPPIPGVRKRQNPASTNLRITGVEVRFALLLTTNSCKSSKQYSLHQTPLLPANKFTRAEK